MENVLVSVLCMTYNQVDYIRQTLEGFVMQKTPFSFEVLVHDDASTDGTEDIVREYEKKYPELIKGVYEKENQYSQRKPIGRRMFEMAKGKYVAHCEGDDFWTDPDKLRLQVEYMEQHDECSLCACAGYYTDKDSKLSKDRHFRPYTESRVVPTEDIISKWLFPTASIVYRRSSRDVKRVPFKGDCINGDYTLMVYLALKGTVYYIDRLMCAYRVNAKNSISQMQRANAEKHRTNIKKTIEMAKRLDDYTEYKYHEAVEAFIDRNMFNYWASYPNTAEMKKIKNMYDGLSISSKLKYHIKEKLPQVYDLLKNTRSGSDG